MPYFEPPWRAGDVKMQGHTNLLPGWLLCDGSAISRTTYAGLFAAISTSYGVGDGSTTFNLPNFSSIFPMGNTPGATGGANTDDISHTHTIAHTHQIDPPSTTSGAPSATTFGLSLTGSVASPTHTHDTNIAAFTSGAASAANSGSGGNSSHDNRPAFQGIAFVIYAGN